MKFNRVHPKKSKSRTILVKKSKKRTKEEKKNEKGFKETIANFFYACNIKMDLEFYYDVVQAFQFDFLLASFANFRFVNFSGYFGILNLTISAIIVIFYTLMVTVTVFKSVKID